MKILRILVVCIFLLQTEIPSQAEGILELTPSGWWVKMPTESVWILLKGKDLFHTKVSTTYRGVEVLQTITAANKDYLMIELRITNSALPGKVQLQLTDHLQRMRTINFPLWERTPFTNKQKLEETDAIYAIHIDRFANGDPNRDNPTGYFEKTNRNLSTGVHGGDLKGISTKLNYLTQLGFTAIKLSPVQENNNLSLSAVEFAPTNIYCTDKRIADWNEYIEFASNCAQRNLKVIQQFTLHQASKISGTFKDLPFPSWVTPDSKTYGLSSDRYETIDPYTDLQTKSLNYRQWIHPNYPILNQTDYKLSPWLIQSVIWWVESAKLSAIEIRDAWRNQPDFLKQLLSTLQKTHPQLMVIADVPFFSTPHLAGWRHLFAGYTNLAITDYPTTKSISRQFGYFAPPQDAAQELYHHLATDASYPSDTKFILPADAPECNRLWNSADKSNNIINMMLSYTLTLRGIPQLTYGTEILLEGISANTPNNFYRDFNEIGKTDTKDLFNPQFQSKEQIETTQLIQRLLHWRTANQPLVALPPTHLKIQEGVYAHYRTHSGKSMLVIFNLEERPLRIDFRQLPEILSQQSTARDVATGESHSQNTGILLGAKTCAILELANN